MIPSTNLDGELALQRANMKRSFFVDPPGGTEKTFETSGLQRYLKSKGLKVLTLTSLAAAAQFLDGDRAAHSALMIIFQSHHQSTSYIDLNPVLADELCNTSYFILDENIITHGQSVEAVERTFRDLERSTLQYGGNIFLLFEDIRQIFASCEKR